MHPPEERKPDRRKREQKKESGCRSQRWGVLACEACASSSLLYLGSALWGLQRKRETRGKWNTRGKKSKGGAKLRYQFVMVRYRFVIIFLARNRNALERGTPEIEVLENPLLLSGRNIISVKPTLGDVTGTLNRSVRESSPS